MKLLRLFSLVLLLGEGVVLAFFSFFGFFLASDEISFYLNNDVSNLRTVTLFDTIAAIITIVGLSAFWILFFYAFGTGNIRRKKFYAFAYKLALVGAIASTISPAYYSLGQESGMTLLTFGWWFMPTYLHILLLHPQPSDAVFPAIGLPKYKLRLCQK